MGSFYQELKRRKVFRVAAVYGVASWLLLQIADTVLPALQLPDWTITLITVLLIFGFFPTIIGAWAYELTPSGIVREKTLDDSERQSVPVSQSVNYIILIAVLLLAGIEITDRFFSNSSSSRINNTSNVIAIEPSVLRASIDLGHALTANMLGNRSTFTLSDDGSVLYYHRYAPQPGITDQLVTLDLGNHETNVLIQNTRSNWNRLSPDKERLLIPSGYNFLIFSLLGAETLQVPVDKFLGTPGDWLTDQQFLYTGSDSSIHLYSLETGIDAVLTLDEGGYQGTPSGIAGGQAFLYVNAPTGSILETSEVRVFNTENNLSKGLVYQGYLPQYVPTGHIVFMRSEDLWAIRFDSESLEAIGEAVLVQSEIESQPSFGAASYAISESGRLVYLAGNSFIPNNQGLSWLDSNGSSISIPLPPAEYAEPALSNDESKLAVVRSSDDGTRDVWIYDINRDLLSRLTFSDGASKPIWAPDDSHIFYGVEGRGIFRVEADGSSQPELIVSSATALPESVSSRDNTLLFVEGALGSTDLNSLSLESMTESPSPFLNEDYSVWGAEVSPNGDLVAYVSNESGQDEIYVRTYPDITLGKQQVSIRGGREPQWNEDGSRLFYLQQDTTVGVLMAVDFFETNGTSTNGPESVMTNVYVNTNFPPSYQLTSKMDSIIAFTRSGEYSDSYLGRANAEISIVENWFEELLRLSPVETE